MLEFLMCELKAAGSSLIFMAVVYRPPHVAFTTPVDLGIRLQLAMENYVHKIIVGDFNADQLGYGYDADYVRTLMRHLSLKLIDYGLCLVDESYTVLGWDKSPKPLGAGHQPISAVLDIKVLRPLPKTITGSHVLFSHIDWPSPVTASSSMDQGLDSFYKLFFGQLDLVAPVVSLNVNSAKHARWITNKLRPAIHLVRSAHRRFKRTKNPRDDKTFCVTRDSLRSKLAVSRASYYRNRLVGLSPVAMWQERRKLGLLKEKMVPWLPVSVNSLNEAFVQTGSPSTSLTAAGHLHNPSAGPHHPEFRLRSVSKTEVESAVSGFKSLAADEDGLTIKII